MQPTSHAADTADRLDPWGFGTTAADEPTAVMAISDLPDDDLFGDDAGDRDAHDAVAELLARITDAPRLAATSRAPWRPLSATPTLPPASSYAPLPATAAEAAHATTASAVSLESAPAPRSSGRPFSRDMVGVLAIFTLVILGQALYIALSLTGEVRASAAPTGDLVLSSHPAKDLPEMSR